MNYSFLQTIISATSGHSAKAPIALTIHLPRLQCDQKGSKMIWAQLLAYVSKMLRIRDVNPDDTVFGLMDWACTDQRVPLSEEYLRKHTLAELRPLCGPIRPSTTILSGLLARVRYVAFRHQSDPS
jgi:hypothetical protein